MTRKKPVVYSTLARRPIGRLPTSRRFAVLVQVALLLQRGRAMLRDCQYSQLQHYKTLSSLLLLVTYEVAEDNTSQVVRAGSSSDLAAQASHLSSHQPSAICAICP